MFYFIGWLHIGSADIDATPLGSSASTNNPTIRCHHALGDKGSAAAVGV